MITSYLKTKKNRPDEAAQADATPGGPFLRVQNDGDEKGEDDVDEKHDEAVQVDPRKPVDHGSLEGDHAERGEHVVAWNPTHFESVRDT